MLDLAPASRKPGFVPMSRASTASPVNQLIMMTLSFVGRPVDQLIAAHESGASALLDATAMRQRMIRGVRGVNDISQQYL